MQKNPPPQGDIPIEKEKEKKPYYRKPWVRVTAFVLAASMIFSMAARSMIKVSIQPEDEMDAAANYLIENTDYINQNDLQRFQEKLQTYEQAVDLEDHYRLAGTQIAEERYDEALVSIQKCISLYPGDDEELYLDLILKKACLHVLLQQNESALKTLDKVLEIAPDYTDAYLIKAQVYAACGEMQPLLEVLKIYLELAPDQYEIRSVYAQALFESEEYEMAAVEYELLLETADDPAQRAELLYLSGLTYLQLSRYSESEDRLQEAKTLDTELDGLDYYIGVCRMSLERYLEAIDSFTAAVEKDSMIQHSRFSRGVCYLMIEGDHLTPALEDLNFAQQYQGDDADATITQQSNELLAQLEAVADTP